MVIWLIRMHGYMVDKNAWLYGYDKNAWLYGYYENEQIFSSLKTLIKTDESDQL